MLECFSVFYLELPIPAITITSRGDPIAGENYTLICTVTVIDGLTDDVILDTSWTDNAGDPAQLDSAYTVSGVNTTLTLNFNPLLSSHGGQYTCNASVTITATSTVRRNLEPHNIIIQSN